MRVRLRGLWWRLCDVLAGRLPRCDHGFAPDRGIGLWCPACETERRRCRVRAPTIPEAHLGAVILATVLTWSWAGYFAWGWPGVASLVTPLMLIPFGVWLRWAWRAVERERHRDRCLDDDYLRRTMAAAAALQGDQAARAFVQAIERGQLRHLDEGQ